MRRGSGLPERHSYVVNTPDIRSYDVILVNSSGGKDSQAMLDYVVELAREAGVADRIVVVHCDLGRVEWKGTAELAEEQAKHYGARFVKVGRPQGDLLDHVEKRGKWPSSAARYCTSDHKRGQVYKVLTMLADEVRKTGKSQARILNCLGLRADESPMRAKKVAFEFDESASNGRRSVDTWLPIHEWTVEQVWTRIKKSGVRWHNAYDLGMPRLSCCFCVMGNRDSLLLAGHHNRELLDQYVAVEQKINHTFKKGLPILQIREAVERGEMPKGKVANYCM